MIPVDEILESLDLSRAEPGSGFLEALFARFNARVPFENASKIVRDAEIADGEAKPRTPEIFWADHLESGTGGTCFARVAAFDALLSALGFRTRRLVGKVRSDYDHAALLIATPTGESIADVGFPLPALLPARAGFVETGLGGFRIDAAAGGFRVVFEGGVPEGPRTLEIFTAEVTPEEFAAHWRQTFQATAPFLKDVVMRRDFGSRVVSFFRGEVRVDDLHSRLRVPVAPPRAAALSEVFGVDAGILARALAIAGDPAPAIGEAALMAYLETDAAPVEALAAIATREGYKRLLEGVAEIAGQEDVAGGFRLRLSAPGADAAAAIEETIAVDGTALRLSVLRRSGASTFASSYGAERRDGRSYLTREAALSGAREDLLRNDSLRGRLAGTLAVDLLAWARML